jgi:Tol biopolymer transport system component
VFSPDGRSIAFFVAEAGPNGDFWVIASTGGEPRRLTWDVCEVGEPAWTPDGLRVIDATTGDDRELLARRSALWLPEFSPVGDRLAFFHQVGLDIHLFTIASDGSGLRQVTHGAGEWNIHPTWSGARHELWRLTLDGS